LSASWRHISLLLLRPHRLAVRLSVAVTKTLTLSWLAPVVAAELEDSHLRAAVRMEDSPAQPSLDGLAELHAMHPPATLRCSELLSPHRCQPLQVDESVVRKAIMSFPACSAGGLYAFVHSN